MPHRLRPALIVTLLAIFALPSLSPATARTAVVVTNDGNTIEGELISESPAVIVLNVGGIETRFDRENIREFRIPETPEEVYRRERAELSDEDVTGRLDLTQRMIDRDALNIARRELNALERDFPGNGRVAELSTLVNARLQLQNTTGTAGPRRPASPSRPGNAAEAEDPTADYLTDEQINLIQVYELDLDIEPRVVVPSGTIDDLFDRYADDPGIPRGRSDRAAFRRLPGHEQLAKLFEVRARDLYSSIQVRQEPEPLAEFRRSINSVYLARYFVPTFGQGQIDGLELYNRRAGNQAEAYTNFLKLCKFEYDGLPMINRGNPELSLLLQWGLERESARHPAPQIDGWEPRFTDMENEEFQRIARWIDSLYGEETPDYGIDMP